MNSTAALDNLAAVMFEWINRPSVIKPKLNCRGTGTGVRWWRVQMVEESDDDSTWYNQHLEEAVKWTDNQLKDWPNCKRMAHDMWDFKHRKDAEKFITLFHLSWQQ